jgi:hypothetical protein
LRLLLLGFAIAAAAALAVGCGEEDSGAALPSSKEIAQCFEDEGATAVNEKTENEVPTTTALANGGVIAAALTGDEEKSREAIEQFEGLPGLEAFEALEGKAVGLVGEGEAANKRLVLHCLERP